MSLLYNVLFAWKCKSTHHKLALDALRHLRGEDAEAWRDAFLGRIEPYLTGAKAPDDQFKDFKNHVLHVREGDWGGAVEAVQTWYRRTVQALQAEKWSEAVYNAGVLSHYFTDPVQPFHTAQSEEEGIVHRPAEWSIAKSYEELQHILETDQGGYPDVPVPSGDDWLARMVKQGARLANPHYDTVIDHYDVKAGTKDPPAGLDQEIKDRLAPLIGYAAVGFARVLERAIGEAAVRPPRTPVSLLGVLAALTIPLFWVTRKMADIRERAVVEAIYREFQVTGKVLAALPEDDKAIRRLHAEEVSKTPLAALDAHMPRVPGAKHGAGAPARGRTVQRRDEEGPAIPFEEQSPAAASEGERKFYLRRDMPVEQAPSIGSKTAQRLARIGVKTVAHLLDLDADDAAERLGVRHIDSTAIGQWQAQARLACRVPGIRGHDAQILVACGVLEPEPLAAARPASLLAKVEAFVATPEGERVVRDGTSPDLTEVRRWIESARHARPLKAA
jgi:hypothetical protein